MPTWLQILIGIAGVLSPLALFLCGLLITWIRSVQDKQGRQEQELANLRAHVAEHYVRSPEVARLSEEIAGLRHSFDEGMKVLYKMAGSLETKLGG